MLEALRLTRVERVDSIGLRSALSEPPREMWEHDGLCSCGKRTYLFSRCSTCIAREAEEDFARAAESSIEAKEEEENDDLRLEVAGMLAAVEKPSGGLFIPEELVRKWGSGGLIDRLRSSAAVQSVETQFGMLAAHLWKKNKGFRNLGKPCPDFPYRTVWIVMHDGEVVQGHQCCKEETATKLTVEWALEQVHWHNHTSLITEVCERVWENRSAENFPLAFGGFCGFWGRTLELKVGMMAREVSLSRVGSLSETEACEYVFRKLIPGTGARSAWVGRSR